MHKFHIKVGGKPLCENTANGVWGTTMDHLHELRKAKAPGHTIAMSCAFTDESDAITLACIIKELFPGRKVETATGGCPLYGADAMRMQDDEEADIAIAIADTRALSEAAAFQKIHDDIPPMSNVTPLFDFKGDPIEAELEDTDHDDLVTLVREHEERFDKQAGILKNWKELCEIRKEFSRELMAEKAAANIAKATMNRMFESALALIQARAKQEDGGSERAWLKQQEHINGLSSQVTETKTGDATDTE